ncbi:MAG: geranylgeranylglyceryl/heptaprenylglyceryl phosphate synthase [Melioribacteraceae bacterium]|nr:geranylgeranylglyceryl/heptaprenylglyceryl phosphate synthase [Melioribacteraceae bacterium]MCF8354194.1 geranylgeranylglyceryl/heptaprenylglyceryl phosphate synthase [Melioribacteraceae bacterium]MCF8392840.1 geranylgeranylglyceryl/heptaprenylglyceryl phosphate synthase [Melioribacteraceae bacterium]MCF8418674.1 geranylgeranylglyceryl/heptaprenylglyceryl phosphate synthase [Melioribacteraceae bacterium]
MNIYNYLLDVINKKGAAYLLLIDPDKMPVEKSEKFAGICASAGVDAFLIGGSLMLSGNLDESIEAIKKHSNIPVIIFPGSVSQVSPAADALLYISLISGRNADQIIGKHIMAAPSIKKFGIEPISTGYMLIESGKVTTAEYMSGSKPIPRHKPEIAAATALAAQYMGMKLVYLEAGSGADNPVPNEMIKLVSSQCEIPVIVGGGIRDSNTASEKVKCGAKIIVTGNFFEDDDNWERIKEFAEAIHNK